MTTLTRARALALALPESTEQDHHGMPSFRVRGKIFATVPDDKHIRIMVDEAEIRAAVAENPTVCEAGYWGKKLACVVVALRPATVQLLRELLTEAWLYKAPRSLAANFTPAGVPSPTMGDETRWRLDLDDDATITFDETAHTITKIKTGESCYLGDYSEFAVVRAENASTTLFVTSGHAPKLGKWYVSDKALSPK
jgi:hypothetical protein